MDELTPEQIADLQTKAAKVEELEKAKVELEARSKTYETEKADWDKKEKEYQDQTNPNWQKARKSMDAMRTALEEKGVKMDDDGNIVGNPQNVDIQAIEMKAREAARSEILGGRLEEILSQYEPESARLVKHYFGKLTAGESVTLQNLDGFIAQAENAARAGTGSVEIKKIQAAYSTGSGPRYAGDSKEALDDQQAKELGQKMGLGFAVDDKK